MAWNRQQGIYGIRDYKNKNKLTATSRAISFLPSSNKTPPNTPYSIGSKIKAVPEEKSNEELLGGIGYSSYCFHLVIDDYLKMGNMSGGNCSLNNSTLSKHYCDSINGDESSGYGF